MTLQRIWPLVLIVLNIPHAGYAAFTGDPLADGWAFGGHSLSQGSYVRGSGNIGFDIYTTAFTVTDSAPFALVGHTDAGFDDYYGAPRTWDTSSARSWEISDAIVGVGGVFAGVSAADAGWSMFSGAAVNSTIDGEYRFRLQAKIGTPDAAWSSSSIAPDAGDGSGSSSDGGSGSLFVRTSGWLSLDVWSEYAGTMMGLQDPTHLERTGTTVGVDAARILWKWDAVHQRPDSWELLVNTALVAADAAPGFSGFLPQSGDPVIGSVQIANAAYTDGLSAIIATPIPGAAWLFGSAMIALFGLTRKRK